MNGLHVIADVGGTNTRIAVAREGEPHEVRIYPTADISSFETTLEDYLGHLKSPPKLERLCVAAAGPVGGDKGARRINWTDMSWTIAEADLAAAFGIDAIDLMNDFAAQALSLPHLADNELKRLGAGGEAARSGTMAVLGPGTGLGVAGLVKGGHGRFIPIVGEGGHADLAPSRDEEIVLLKILAEQYGHVSAERVLSGPGLVALYTALLGLRGEDYADPEAAAVTDAARSGSEIALDALYLFSGWLGAVAGDVALTFGATGGVYIAGGVVPALGPLFDEKAFRTRFEAKGRFDFYNAAIPTWLVTRENPALLGLARNR
jgi:glucokinase